MSGKPQTETANPPPWLRPTSPGDTFHYPLGQSTPLVIFPSSSGRHAVLDGEFSSSQLRDIADWIDRSVNDAE